MQFSGLHKLVKTKKAEKANEQEKLPSLNNSTTTASRTTVSNKEIKRKHAVNDDPYAVALQTILHRKQDMIEVTDANLAIESEAKKNDNECCSVESKEKLEHINKDMNELDDVPMHKKTKLEHQKESELVVSSESNTEEREQEKDYVYNKNKPINNNSSLERTEISIHNSNKVAEAALQSEEIILSKSECDELRNNAITILTTILFKINLSNSVNVANRKEIRQCNIIYNNVIVEHLKNFLFRERFYDNKHMISTNELQNTSSSSSSSSSLFIDKLSQLVMKDEDKKEFYLLYMLQSSINDKRDECYCDEAKNKNNLSAKVDRSNTDNENYKGNDNDKDEVEQLESLLCVLWFLITSHWCHDFNSYYDLPTIAPLSTSTSTAITTTTKWKMETHEQTTSHSSLKMPPNMVHLGWSYDVYLHSVKRFTNNNMAHTLQIHRMVAEALKKWTDAQHLRRGALEMICYLMSDLYYVTSVERSYATHAKCNESEKLHTIIPSEIRCKLYELFVIQLHKNKNFIEARQIYVNLTMGNANWKLGLFSAGEVHMRRSIERVERNRVTSLLNNERAMLIMHSLRELIEFAEHVLPSMTHCCERFYSYINKV